VGSYPGASLLMSVEKSTDDFKVSSVLPRYTPQSEAIKMILTAKTLGDILSMKYQLSYYTCCVLKSPFHTPSKQDKHLHSFGPRGSGDKEHSYESPMTHVKVTKSILSGVDNAPLTSNYSPLHDILYNDPHLKQRANRKY